MSNTPQKIKITLTCPECGRAVSGLDNFCSKCRANLASLQHCCPGCGERVLVQTSEYYYCSFCGRATEMEIIN